MASRALTTVAILFAAIFLLGGCKSIPEGRTSVNEIQVRGANEVDEDEIKEKIATTESKKFLGLFRGVVFEYSTLDRFVLQRDLARVEAFYRSKGFYDAHARAGRAHTIDEKHVRVEVVVEEGRPSLVRTIRIDGIEDLPPDVIDAAKRAAGEGVRKDRPIEQEALELTEGRVRRALSDRGYAYAKVKADAAVDLVAHAADVVFAVSHGPTCTFGAVTIEGLGTLPEKPVRRAVDIQEGAPYSELTLENAQQALLDLGVFAGVEVKPDVPENPPDSATARPNGTPEDATSKDPGSTGPVQGPPVVPVRVKVEPSRLHTIRLGGGVEFDSLKTDLHAIVGWEHKNFLGGLRNFQVAFRPGVVLYPVRVNNIVAPTALLPEERLRIDVKQPGFIEARTNGFLRPELNVQPVLLNPDPPPDARVIGYAELRNAIGAERTFWKLFASLSHNVQFAYPFAYVGTKDPTLGQILISYPELLTNFDFRDDKVHPRKGVFIGNTLQVAGLGGDARDVKVQPEVRGYVPVHKRVVWASRASVGFLVPSNYGDVVRKRGSTFDAASEERTKDYQLTFFRGFFSGGPTSNRGYPIRGIGPYDVVPFLSPENELGRVNAGCGTGDLSDRCRAPTGGFTIWEASTELRISVSGPLSVATFCDASDVSPQVADLRFDHLHLSCGAGGRYDTPVGPVRLDIGYRIPGAQVLGGLTPDEREPTRLLGIPIAVHIGIGEAY
ncbi:MAG: BamA/TamA family outer membrane protein [Deltaproteobacteria bacterium]|nr:BamA/TamA family outer membrane protein [Deltaproteobacteria bacterium]